MNGKKSNPHSPEQRLQLDHCRKAGARGREYDEVKRGFRRPTGKKTRMVALNGVKLNG